MCVYTSVQYVLSALTSPRLGFHQANTRDKDEDGSSSDTSIVGVNISSLLSSHVFDISYYHCGSPLIVCAGNSILTTRSACLGLKEHLGLLMPYIRCFGPLEV